jgi:hypothetical protein
MDLQREYNTVENNFYLQLEILAGIDVKQFTIIVVVDWNYI